jgi:predicted ArsR family transcriptional regulator
VGHKRDGSLIRRIELWFDENRHEWLTVADMAAKFDASEHQIRDALQRLYARDGVQLEAVTVYRVRQYG